MTAASARVTDAATMIERLRAEWKVPLTAGIEISDHCNEVCVHCYQEQGRKGEMTTEQLFGVIDELAGMGVMFLTLSGGEATLRKDFLAIVEYASKKGFAVRLFTNGLSMTRELARALGKLNVQSVEISVYSTEPELHDFVTGVRGSFVKTTSGVRYLVEAGVAVTIKTPVMSINESEAARYAALAKELGADYSLSPNEMMPREGQDRAPEAFELSDRARVTLMRELSSVPVEECGIETNRPLSSAPCGAGRGIHIEPNGELRACTNLNFDLGHVLTDGVASAHASNTRALQLRQLSWAQLHGCRECDLRPYCQRCYAAALAHTGDALGPYASACRGASLRYEAWRGRAPVILPKRAAAQIGPYRKRGEDVFECVDDDITVEDEALAERLGWVRRSSGGLPEPGVVARPGDLVQIRRPGRKQPKLERIPVSANAAETVEVSRDTDGTDRRSNAS